MSNIQVVVRCRGRNSQEIAAKSPIVVELTNDNYSITEPYITINQAGATPNTSASSLDTNSKRTYKFDQIYGSQADQNLIYSQIAHPLLLDFLRGINVTVLAYGQTGTGKTYTMSGMDNNNKLDENSDIAGIIPRLLGELFQNLSSNATRIKYLKMGLQKKKTSSTNLNETSSRSHTIFSVQLYQKISSSSSSSSENDNEESVYRISKMNLVDLAGSENISRSGSIVKEAGGINQSLLTLGRVINSLNEKKLSHIPYRESKLTHILQDSLGGNTKTTLIATISPAQVNLSETCSTLDYASKAKNIKNAPMIGHDSEIIMKKTLVKNLAQELTLLNMDLIATRNKNGVYLDPENYDQLIQENESLKTGAKEDRLKLESLQAKIETLEFTKLEAKEEIDNLKQQLQSYQSKLQILETKYHKAVGLNQTNQETICELNNKLKRAFEKSSNEYKQQLETNLQNYQSQVGNIVNEDLTNYISTFQKNFDNLLTFQQEFYNKTFEVIQDFKIINEKLSGFLKDDYLHNIETNLNSQLGNILGENLPILVDNFKKIMTKELKTTMNNVMDKYKTVSNEEISKERENVLKMENSWNSQINCLLPKLETDLNNNNKFHHDCQTNLQKFINNNDICERINKFQQDNNSQLDK
ncbi:Kinesin motor domain family protein [Candida albicans]|uniref:Kinesin-like protein n=1 Tax=Candida albicans TaxID=5476 RepID=A0A8H6BV81_CANAX|nr:Kinesin motor domain family protein [Candida albicans]